MGPRHTKKGYHSGHLRYYARLSADKEWGIGMPAMRMAGDLALLPMASEWFAAQVARPTGLRTA